MSHAICFVVDTSRYERTVALWRIANKTSPDMAAPILRRLEEDATGACE